jgi:3-hexulose-6-phosphate synthase
MTDLTVRKLSNGIKEIVAEEPDLVIVGGGIANADDPVEAAKQCREAIEGK